MKHARADYNERIQDKAKLIPADEPVLLLRGQDRFAHLAARYYAAMVRQAADGRCNRVADVVELQAERMAAWAQQHGKEPDVPENVVTAAEEAGETAEKKPAKAKSTAKKPRHRRAGPKKPLKATK
jgi:hypothetical protein